MFGVIYKQYIIYLIFSSYYYFLISSKKSLLKIAVMGKRNKDILNMLCMQDVSENDSIVGYAKQRNSYLNFPKKFCKTAICSTVTKIAILLFIIAICSLLFYIR